MNLIFTDTSRGTQKRLHFFDSHPKWKLIMRISVFHMFLLMCGLQLLPAHTVNSQSLDVIQVTVELHNKDLKTLFREIENQTGLLFAYQSQIVEHHKGISLSGTNSVKSILDLVLEETALGYRQVNNSVIIFSKKREKTRVETLERNKEAPIPQGFMVEGTVIDENGEAMFGVAVTVKGTSRGVTTNDKGHFAIGFASPGILSFSYLGYKNREIPVSGPADLKITLEPDFAKLDEVIVMGYGTTTKRSNTGSISKITAKEIENQPVTNVLQALQGRMPGVLITQNNGYPGSGIDIQIRGINSINNGAFGTSNANLPLYVIDGVPYLADPINRQAGNNQYLDGANGATSPLNSINPDDIESIEILKDADATAIYGSRGANGVVLITTKGPRQGKTSFTFNASTGISKARNFVDTYGTDRFLEIRRKGFENSGLEPNENIAPDLTVWDRDAYTDWQKMLIGNSAYTHNVNASVTGGSGQTNFLLSGAYHKETTVLPGNEGYNRFSANLKVNHKSVNDKLRIGASVVYTTDKNDLSVQDLTGIAYRLAPNFPLYNEDGSLYWTGTFTGPSNPLGLLNRRNESKTNNLVSSVNLEYEIVQGLHFKTDLGYSRAEMRSERYTPSTAQDPGLSSFNISSVFSNNNTENYIVEPQLTYNTPLWKGNLNVLLGGSWQHRKSEMPLFVLANGFTSDDFMENVNLAETISYNSASSEYKYASVFGRINYNLLGKYILNLNYRRDGSSRFGTNNRYGNFGSVGAAWVFSEELFMNGINWLSFGKLRGSYGEVGNDAIGDYGYLETYQGIPSGYGGWAAMIPSRVANPDYQWEVTKKLEMALELGFLDDRLSLEAAFYRNRTGNQLINYTLSPQAGFSSYQANLPALVENRGWEFAMRGTPVTTRDFSWNTTFNISFNSNKLLKFPGIENTSYYTRYIVGRPLSSHYLYLFTGFNPETGLPEIEDLDGDGSATWGYADTERGDRVYKGAAYPQYFGGLGNTLNYKGFSLDFFFRFVKQKGRSLLASRFAPPGYNMDNVSVAEMDPYLSQGLPGQPQVIAAWGPAYGAFGDYVASDATLVDASFIRLQNVNLSYAFNREGLKKIGLEDLSLYVQGQNLLTITNYKGFDPESQGESLPPLRTITIGTRFTF